MKRTLLAATSLLVVALFASRIVFAAPGDTTRASISTTGVQGDGTSSHAALSADGRFVAFESAASNLVDGDTNGQPDIFVRDRQSGSTERVSVAADGAQANAGSHLPAISADGRFVAFVSAAGNLVPGDTNPNNDIFVRDRQAHTTERVDLTSAGAQVVNQTYAPAISADGRFVAFHSPAAGFVAGDTNGFQDVFVRDRQAHTTERVSVTTGGVQGNGDSTSAALSGDGRYVAFQSSANNLVAGDTNAKSDIFVRDRQTGITERVSVDAAGVQGNNSSQHPAISADGHTAGFQSNATNLVGGDTNSQPDVFVHDLQTGATERIDLNSSGLQGGSADTPAISADGRYVAFYSSYAFAAGGDNGWADIYVRDRSLATTERASVDSSGAQASGGHSVNPAIDADGKIVAFDTAANNLVPGDTNNQGDVFVREMPLPQLTTPSDLSVTMTGSDDVPAGSNVVYTVVVKNNGPTMSGPISTAITLPSAATFVSCRLGLYISCDTAFQNGAIPFQAMGATDAITYTVTARVSDWTPNGSALQSAASVRSGTPDPDMTNNSATTTLHTAVATRRPVIVVPGVGGTTLVNTKGERWLDLVDVLLDPNDRQLLELQLGPGGALPLDPSNPDMASLHIGDVMRVEGPQDVYKTTFDTFAAAGYREGADLFRFAYDWRLDVRTNGALFRTFVDNVLHQTARPQVNILAHSMGGLVSLNALSDASMAGKVHKLETLGAPILGAPKALGLLQFRAPCFLDDLPLLGCPLNPTTLQTTFNNWPGGYELLPSRVYHQAEGTPYTDELAGGDQTYDQWTALVRQSHNGTVLDQTAAYHQAADPPVPADPALIWRRAIGYQVQTVNHFRNYNDCFLWVFFCHPSIELRYGDGDGTVPRHSADLYNPATGFDQRNGNRNVYYPGVTHPGLPIDHRVLADALSFFADAPDPAPLPDNATIDGVEVEVVGRLSGFAQRNLTIPAANSAAPAAAAAADDNALGHVPGQPADLVTNKIPGASYNAAGDTQSFFLTDAASYDAKLTSDDGTAARLRVRTYHLGQVSGQAEFDLQPPAGAGVKLSFTTTPDLAALRVGVDTNGDGVPDQQVAPAFVVTGAAVADKQPPVTAMQTSAAGAGQVQVTLTARDEPGGSGVAATYVMVAGVDAQPRLYTGSFTMPAGTVIRFASVDRAGNAETIHELPRRVFVPLVRR